MHDFYLGILRKRTFTLCCFWYLRRTFCEARACDFENAMNARVKNSLPFNIKDSPFSEWEKLTTIDSNLAALNT